MNLHNNMSLKDALQSAVGLGFVVEDCHDGETRISHPRWPRHLLLSRTRREAGKKLVARLRVIQKLREAIGVP